MNVLNWLQEWYRQNRTDEWEHFYGIKIDNGDDDWLFLYLKPFRVGLCRYEVVFNA